MAKLSRRFKPIPDQPKEAPSNLNQPLSTANAAKRAHRHAENEAAREPSKRLMARDDLDMQGRRIYTFRWLSSMDFIMRLWCQFFQQKLDRSDGPSFFTVGGPHPDRLLLHQFLFWAGDTSVGNIYTSSHAPSTVTETNKVTTSTVERYVVSLASAFGYYNTGLPHNLVESAKRWVRNNLSRELRLNREVKDKPIAYMSDVAQLIEAIWSYRSITAFKNIRAMLNTTLVLNSLVDSASRIGEFIPTDSDSQAKGRYLKWEDLDLYMTPSNDEDGITIHIVVQSKWLKRHTNDPGMYKGIVIRLLPPYMAFQDSCRLLIVLALHHGFLRDFRTWDELLSCKPSKHGSPILLQQACLQQPVFSPLVPQLARIAVTDSHAEADESGDTLPWNYGQLQRIVQNLSRLAGFAHKTGLHQLRHGDAYLLAKHCKDRDTARLLMGQQDDSDAFSNYLSKTSTTDIQGLARGLPTYDLTQISGLSLGRCTNAPVTLPEEELAAIDTHPEIIEAAKARDDAREECIRQFGSLQATRKAAQHSPAAAQLMEIYHKLSYTKSGIWKRQAELRFRAFREASVRELTAARPTRSDAITVAADESTASIDNDLAIDAIEADEDLYPEDGDLFIQDRIEDVGRLTVSEAASIVSAVPDATTVEEGIPGNAMHEAFNQHVRSHSILRTSLNSMVGIIGRQNTLLSSFSYDYIHLGAKYEQITKNENITSREVMETLLNLLSNERHMRDIPSHWISKRDPFICIVCESPLLADTGYTHVRKCLQNEAKEKADRLFVEYCDTLPKTCSWVPTVASKACKVDLTNASPNDRQQHFHKHNNSTGYKCYWGGCRVIFSSHEELFAHVYAIHKILLCKSSSLMYFWCQYCNKSIFLTKSTPERLMHFASHYKQAIQAVTDYGYPGVSIGSSHAGHRPNEFLPAHCVFCLHNETLNAEDKLISPTMREMPAHMHSHFRYLGTEDRIYCPASSAGGAINPLCTYKQSMTPTEAWKHIQDIHYAVEFGPRWGPNASGKVRGKRAIEDDDDDDSHLEQDPKMKARTKTYEKKKPVVIQSGGSSVPGKMVSQSTPSIGGFPMPAQPLQEKSSNKRLKAKATSTSANKHTDDEA